jgi:hypothetical protein
MCGNNSCKGSFPIPYGYTDTSVPCCQVHLHTWRWQAYLLLLYLRGNSLLD